MQSRRIYLEDLTELWEEYNIVANKLSKALGRTLNIVGEYAEHLTAELYKGELLPASQKSADVKVIENDKEILYQVKARKIKKLSSSQLGIIRSWEFNFLIVIIFDLDGKILKALEVPVDVAKKYGVWNDHQKGWVITTTKVFLEDSNSRDITELI